MKRFCFRYSLSMLAVVCVLQVNTFHLLMAQESLPLCDQNTLGYLTIDLEKLDVERDSSNLNKTLGLPKSILSEIFDLAKACHEHSATKISFVLSMDELVTGRGLPIAIAVPNKQAADELAKDLTATNLYVLAGLEYSSSDTTLIIGASQTLKRWEQFSAPRHEAANQFSKMSEGSLVSLVLIPSSAHRRVMRETMPVLPEPFQSLTGDLLADGARTIVVRMASTSPFDLSLKVTGADSESNRRLSEYVSSGVGAIQNDWLQLPFPINEKFKLALNLFKPNQDQNHFEIQIDDADTRQLRRLLEPTLSDLRSTVQTRKQLNVARQLAIGMHNYCDANKKLPPVAITDKDGKPLLSWRVALLPWIDQSRFYNEFNLDEPWDSPHNLKLANTIPAQYLTDESLAADGKTQWVMPVGPRYFGQADGVKFSDLTDGTSNTIMFLKVAPEKAVLWTKPDDWDVDTSDIKSVPFSKSQSKTIFARADASVGIMSDETSIKTIFQLLTIAGGEVVYEVEIKQ